MIAAIGFGGIMFLMLRSLLLGHITVSVYASVLASMTTMYAMCDDAAWHFLAPFNGIASVKNFLTLLNVEVPKHVEKKITFTEGIDFEKVSYVYPGTDRKVLDNISFHIKAGETVAIVGVNGSGKTTLTRLIMGLYLPTEGSVGLRTEL